MKKICILALGALIPSLATAADPSTEPSTENVPSYDIVYTPNRVAEEKSETLANVTVITQEEIEQKQYQSLEEVLNTLPGVTIAQSGGKGTTSSLFYRGTNSNHSVILIDGVRLVSVTTGAPNLSIIPVSMIERVEAVSGANSGLYGADAIGGVIQIFTKKGQAGKTLTNLEVGGGSNNTKQASAHVSTSTEDNNAWISVNTSYEKTNSFDARVNSNAPFASNEPDDDGYRNKAVSMNAGVKFLDDKATFSVNALTSSDDVDFDGNGANSSRMQQQNISAKLELRPTEKLNIALSHAESQDKSHNKNRGTLDSAFNSKYKQSSIIGAYQFNDSAKMVLGSDFIHEDIDTTSNYSQTSRHSKAGFVLGSYKIHNTTLEGNIRVDDSSQFDTEETGGLAISQDIGALKVTLSHKKAFHAPTLSNLYGGFFSSPDLAPEKSRTTELMFQGKIKNVSSSLSFYRTRIEDLIVFNPPNFIPENVDRSRIKGVDFNTAADFGDTQLTLQVSSMSAKDKSSGDDLLRRPKLQGSFGATHKIDKLTLGTQIQSQSYSPDFGSVGGYTTFDATAQYQIMPSIIVGLKGQNLSNKQYERVFGYNQPDREYHAFIRYTGSH